MIKIKNKILITVSVVIFLGVILYLNIDVFVKKKDFETNYYREKNTSEISNTKDFIRQDLSKVTEKKEIIKKEAQIDLYVLDKKYNLEFNEGESLYDAMYYLMEKESSDFYFSGKKNIALGFFVESINGLKNSNNKYWIYYVNTKEADIGISNYILKKSDIINWNLE